MCHRTSQIYLLPTALPRHRVIVGLIYTAQPTRRFSSVFAMRALSGVNENPDLGRGFAVWPARIARARRRPQSLVMSTLRVSGRKIIPITRLPAATTIGYQSPAQVSPAAPP